jgi:hypothetical protein
MMRFQVLDVTFRDPAVVQGFVAHGSAE